MNSKHNSQCEDIARLQDLYEAMISSKIIVREGESPFDSPEYSEEVYALMHHIMESSICDNMYDPVEAKSLINNLHNLNLKEACSLLTAMSRWERFCSGAWINIIESGQFKDVITRAAGLCK